MQLYLLRHAHAEDGGGSDHDRKLTDEGLRYAALAGKMLAKLDVRPAHIYTSPRVRSQQTADLVGAALNVPVETHEAVNFGFGIPAIAQLTEGLRDSADVLFVGHEPFLSQTVRDLTGGLVEMKKCGLARIDLIERVPPRGELVWLLAPKIYEAF